jgi:hypothetical protein
MAETGCYLYAVVRSSAAAPEGTGLRAAPLLTVEDRGLSAVVSAVDLDEFGEDGLRRHMEDITWLEEVARGHDDVVRRLADHGAVAPLRLATICLDEDGVRSRLGEWHDELDAALRRVEGRAEWSVKLYVDRPDAAPGAREPVSREPGAGAAYLRRKQTESRRRQEAGQQATDAAERLHAVAADHAVASRRLQPQDPRLTGEAGTMLLNGAYLVPADDDSFVAAVDGFATQHPDLRVVVQGPWPPYSFASLEAQ